MKAMACEICGSHELIKQDGVFVCKNCGLKYSVEEAKKMMIEGTVDVNDIVKVDNTSFVEKCLANARRAKQKADWEEVVKYYNLVEQNDPTNMEAIFYSSYGKAMLSMIDGDIYKRQQICNVFCNTISIIDDNYNIENTEENQKLITQMNLDLFSMYNTNFVYIYTDDVSSVSYDSRTKTFNLFAEMALHFIKSVDNIIKVDNQLIYWKTIYQQYKYLVGNNAVSYVEKEKYRNFALSIGNQIHEIDPSFTVDTIELPEPSGCYVATAIYESYDCPEVWTLRRYRDYTLAETWYGRAFIKTYYAISPTLVKWFGHTKWFRKMWKPKLDKMVRYLNDKGVKNTPYNDRKW